MKTRNACRIALFFGDVTSRLSGLSIGAAMVLASVVSNCEAEMIASSSALAPATPATGTFEFFQDNALEATIELTSTTPGEQDNGIQFQLQTSAYGNITFPGISGNREYGCAITLPDDVGGIAYPDIAEVLSLIPEVTAAVTFVVGGATYEPLIQFTPAMVTLAGGANVVIPAPSLLELESNDRQPATQERCVLVITRP